MADHARPPTVGDETGAGLLGIAQQLSDGFGRVRVGHRVRERQAMPAPQGNQIGKTLPASMSYALGSVVNEQRVRRRPRRRHGPLNLGQVQINRRTTRSQQRLDHGYSAGRQHGVDRVVTPTIPPSHRAPPVRHGKLAYQTTIVRPGLLALDTRQRFPTGGVKACSNTRAPA
jgi:hypothetical protein